MNIAPTGCSAAATLFHSRYTCITNAALLVIAAEETVMRRYEWRGLDRPYLIALTWYLKRPSNIQVWLWSLSETLKTGKGNHSARSDLIATWGCDEMMKWWQWTKRGSLDSQGLLSFTNVKKYRYLLAVLLSLNLSRLILILQNDVSYAKKYRCQFHYSISTCSPLQDLTH